jgi:hypothetical protein
MYIYVCVCKNVFHKTSFMTPQDLDPSPQLGCVVGTPPAGG